MTPHPSPLAIVAAILFLAGATGLYAWTSRINQFFFFSRSIPRELLSTPAAAAIRRGYIAAVASGFVLSTAIMLALHGFAHWTVLMATIIAVLLLSVISHGAFAWAHRTAGLAFPEVRTVVSDAKPAFGEAPAAPSTISVPLLKPASERSLLSMLLPGAAAAMVWLVATWLSGQRLSAFAEKAGNEGGAVLLGMAAGMLCSGTASLLLLRYSARHRTPMAKYISRTMQWVMALSVLMVAGVAAAGLRGWTVTRGTAHGVMLTVLALVMLHIVYAWTRTKTFTPPAAEQNGDEHWRWGLFYYNPGDPALVVQSRMGPGYTLNFGHSYSWPICAFAVADLVFVIFARHHL